MTLYLQAEGRDPSSLTPAELQALAELGLVDLETLSGTPIHPIWYEDRQDWVPLGELIEGETLRSASGLATVLSLTLETCSLPVYNIEVHGQHVYQVGELGLLVHNAYPTDLGSGFALPSLGKSGARELAAKMGLPNAQTQAVNRAIGRATSTSGIKVTQYGPNVLVEIFRKGDDGFQVIESIIRIDGRKCVVHKAYDAFGNLVHFDPK